MSNVPALQRGLEIIRKIASEDYTLSRLEEELNIPKASFGRLIRCLDDNHFIKIDPISKLVLPGDDLLHSAMNSYERSPLHRDTSGMLARLGNRWQQTFVIHEYREPFTAVWRAKTAPCNAINTRSIGYSMQGLNSNAQGQWFMSQLPVKRVDDFFRQGLERIATEQTISDPGILKERLQQVRRQGYVYIEEENSPMMKQLAIPLELTGQSGMFCLTCYLPLDFAAVDELKKHMIFETKRLTGIK